MIPDLIIQYGYMAAFLILSLGIFGLPIPDEFIVTFVGSLVGLGHLSLSIAILITIVGVLIGTLFTFTLGRKLGKPIINKYGIWIGLTPRRLMRVESWFNKYGSWAVTLGYFVPGMRHLVCYVSGMSGMNTRKYMCFATIGTCVSSIICIAIGYFIGSPL